MWMRLVLQPLSMSSSITLCLHPPLLSGPPASHSSRLSEKLSPSKTLQMLSVCGGFHHCGERRLHCRASNSSVFARQRPPLLKKTHQNSFLMTVVLSVYSCMSNTQCFCLCVCVCFHPAFHVHLTPTLRPGVLYISRFTFPPSLLCSKHIIT